MRLLLFIIYASTSNSNLQYIYLKQKYTEENISNDKMVLRSELQDIMHQLIIKNSKKITGEIGLFIINDYIQRNDFNNFFENLIDEFFVHKENRFYALKDIDEYTQVSNYVELLIRKKTEQKSRFSAANTKLKIENARYMRSFALFMSTELSENCYEDILQKFVCFLSVITVDDEVIVKRLIILYKNVKECKFKLKDGLENLKKKLGVYDIEDKISSKEIFLKLNPKIIEYENLNVEILTNAYDQLRLPNAFSRSIMCIFIQYEFNISPYVQIMNNLINLYKLKQTCIKKNNRISCDQIEKKFANHKEKEYIKIFECNVEKAVKKELVYDNIFLLFSSHHELEIFNSLDFYFINFFERNHSFMQIFYKEIIIFRAGVIDLFFKFHCSSFSRKDNQEDKVDIKSKKKIKKRLKNVKDFDDKDVSYKKILLLETIKEE